MRTTLKSAPIIALDADGVLLDYNAAYQHAWMSAFGVLPPLRDKNAYWAKDRWDVNHLSGQELDYFRSSFNAEFWKTIPPIPNALKACVDLCAAGFELVCVSAIEPQFQSTRLENLKNCGFPIERVIATSGKKNGFSPKAQTLKELRPVAFADDFLPYFRGIPSEIHAALVLREPIGSPNSGEELNLAHSQHFDLADFASWWIDRCGVIG